MLSGIRLSVSSLRWFMSTLFEICILFLNVSWKISRLTFKVAAIQWMCHFSGI
jgi:hypothetical protein